MESRFHGHAGFSASVDWFGSSWYGVAKEVRADSGSDENRSMTKTSCSATIGNQHKTFKGAQKLSKVLTRPVFDSICGSGATALRLASDPANDSCCRKGLRMLLRSA
jgi:hypothetical protein